MKSHLMVTIISMFCIQNSFSAVSIGGYLDIGQSSYYLSSNKIEVYLDSLFRYDKIQSGLNLNFGAKGNYRYNNYGLNLVLGFSEQYSRITHKENINNIDINTHSADFVFECLYYFIEYQLNSVAISIGSGGEYKYRTEAIAFSGSNRLFSNENINRLRFPISTGIYFIRESSKVQFQYGLKYSICITDDFRESKSFYLSGYPYTISADFSILYKIFG